MPWPKGRPLPPEMSAKLREGSRRAVAAATPEQRAERARRQSEGQKRAWAAATPEARAARALAGAQNLIKARACITSVNDAARRAAVARWKKVADDIGHLTEKPRKDYWLFRSKKFNHAEALSLVETGILP